MNVTTCDVAESSSAALHAFESPEPGSAV